MSCSKYDFYHLILLIGTNPLPNFVVADYFLKHNEHIKKIWLVHSEKNNLQAGTNTQADNLEELLKKKWNEEKRHKSLQFPLEKVSVSDVSNAKTIQDDIEAKMIKELKKDKVHLNYTGGTKAMSTHVYWVVKDKIKDKASFSYLDARKFRLIDDEEGVIADDLREEITIKFEELIKLHGFERCNKDDEFKFSESLVVFEKLINNNELHLFYDQRGGYNRKLFENNKGDLAEKVKELNKEKIDAFIPNGKFKEVVMKTPSEYRLFTDEGKFNWSISNKKVEKAVEFIDGQWFEHYIEKVLQEFLQGLSHPILQNWHIKKPEWEKNLDFELDVILLNGYQLTGISCTTSSTKGLCKSKGFEIIHRTRQIGGDESKAVLITRLKSDDKNKLQDELLHDTGGDKNILVLGIDDLKKDQLTSEIEKFIFEKE